MKKSKSKRPSKTKAQLLMELAAKKFGELKISACWIVRNEAEKLRQSINSVKEYVDELIVVDTGSTDQTIETAQRLGAKVFEQAWADDFSAPRNLAIENAGGDWIIFLDADEFLAKGLAENIRPAINIAVQYGKQALLINLVNIDVERHNAVIDSTYLCRIFKKLEGIHYVGRIHEELRTGNGAPLSKVLTVQNDVLKIWHTGYSSSLNRNKAARNLKMLLRELEETDHPERIYGYLAQCYNGLDDSANAEKYARLAIEKSPHDSTFASSPHRILLEILSKDDTARLEERFEAAANAVEKFPLLPEFRAELAECLAAKGDYPRAISEMKAALKHSASYNGIEPTMFNRTMADFAAERIDKWNKILGGHA